MDIISKEHVSTRVIYSLKLTDDALMLVRPSCAYLDTDLRVQPRSRASFYGTIDEHTREGRLLGQEPNMKVLEAREFP